MRTKTSNAFFKHYSSVIIKLFLLIALTLFINTLAANEEKPPTETNSSEDSSSEDNKASSPEKKPDPKKQSAKTPSSKTRKASGFKPSEEISEDYSVPFPVDI